MMKANLLEIVQFEILENLENWIVIPFLFKFYN